MTSRSGHVAMFIMYHHMSGFGFPTKKVKLFLPCMLLTWKIPSLGLLYIHGQQGHEVEMVSQVFC